MVRVIEHNYAWRGGLARRNGPPKSIPLHHSASALTTTVADIHRWHLAIPGYRGIGYHYIIYPNGEIHQGRPEWAYGGHTKNANDGIGICFIGNFQKHDMPAKQRESGRKLVAALRGRYGRSLPAPRHRDVPGNSTACPGSRFPYGAIVNPAPVKPPGHIALTDKNITVPRQHKPGRAGWWNLGFVPWIDKIRKQGDGDRIDTHRSDDRIKIPVPVKRPDWWTKMMRWRRSQRT